MGLLRFLLAIAVVVGHIKVRFDVHFALLPGDLAVEVFFSISGFYMSLILTDKYHDRTTFYLNRFLRLYPVYLIVSVATWLWFFFTWMYLGKLPTNAWIDTYEHLSWWQVAPLVISNWTMVGLDIPSAKWAGDFRTIGPAWSIGVEIWFYLIAPFLVALRSRWIMLIGVTSIVLKSVMMKFGLETYFFFPAHLYFFMAGMLLHRAYVTNSFGKFDRRIGYVVLTVVAALLMCFDRLPKPVAVYVIYAALIPAIPILFDLTRKSRFDIALGNLSYPIYLVHWLIISMAFSVLRHTNVNINGDVMAVTIIMAALVASIILYLVVDKPIDEIRQWRATAVNGSPQPEAFQAINAVTPRA